MANDNLCKYSEIDHVRTMDIVLIPRETRSKGYQVFGGNSNFMQEALGGMSHNASYSYEAHWRVLSGDS